MADLREAPGTKYTDGTTVRSYTTAMKGMPPSSRHCRATNDGLGMANKTLFDGLNTPRNDMTMPQTPVSRLLAVRLRSARLLQHGPLTFFYSPFLAHAAATRNFALQ